VAVAPGLKNEPTTELLRRLLDRFQSLLDKQIELAKQELREDLRRVLGGGKMLGFSIALLVIAGISLLHFVFLLVDTFIPGRWGWAAALVCTVLFGILGAVLLGRGIEQVKVKPLDRTIETLKEDAEWARHQLTLNGKSSRSEEKSPQPSAS
jgi:uncharacterized membrane protein YqjE